MAMPGQNVTPSHLPPPGNWIPSDGRDGFISWIRGEFAAANAIIDSLCQHLIAIGDSNEYEAVISSIQHRQLGWSQVLYMQQFFPIAEVSFALNQVTWKRQQKMSSQGQQYPQRQYNSDQVGKFGGGRRSGHGFNKHYGGRNGHYSDSIDRGESREEGKVAVTEEKRDGSEETKIDNKDEEENESGTQVELMNSDFKDNSLFSKQKLNEKEKEKEKESTASIGKTFVVQEMYEAENVNVVEGMKLYDKILEVKEVSQLYSFVNNMRMAGRRGQLQSEAYVSYKRPNRGHGREMIQLGLPIADTPPDDEIIKDRRIEPIPSGLSNVIERLVAKGILPVKPDACMIDFFFEGDHSQPHMLAPWFGRPVGILSLSECDFTFGRVIVSDYPGDYKGSLKLSLTPGSVLVLEGKSADLAKFAINSMRKQRVLITLTKAQPRNYLPGPNWGPPPSRSPNHHFRHPTGPPKHYHPVIPTPGVLPTPSQRPPNGAVQPIFIAPSPPLAPFPVGVPPGPTVWPMPRHQPPPQPRMPIPGTGVFLPPGSSQEMGLQGSPEKSNGSSSAERKSDVKRKEEEACNGTAAEEETN